MEIGKTIERITSFKELCLKSKVKQLEKSIKTKRNLLGLNIDEVYEAALEIKELSKQVNEIIHATGIIRCLHSILDEDEKVESLSLASSGGIDLETDRRIAEFKFARWQEEGGNGMRERGVFADLVGLYVHDRIDKKKELYVMDSGSVLKFLNDSGSGWFEKLSKSTRVRAKLEKHIEEQKLSGIQTVKDVYELASHHVRIIDINVVIGTTIEIPT